MSNTLLGMCVLKHSKILRLPVLKECFNTIRFLVPQKECCPGRRLFVPVYSAAHAPC
jgi:hypothetical protein